MNTLKVEEKKTEILLCASVGMESHQHGLESHNVCGRFRTVLKNYKPN
jgi:hypothetical protein